jgi:hypothetical protein
MTKSIAGTLSFLMSVFVVLFFARGETLSVENGGNPAAKVAVIGDFERLSKEMDLTAIELSKKDGIAVLERSE